MCIQGPFGTSPMQARDIFGNPSFLVSCDLLGAAAMQRDDGT
jgi:hypothetical protein